ncbi:hypothetical protein YASMINEVIRUS_1432 [Yasminevirus sp. GU-2018]|uniref:Uncharacterized protein n=1 Tax=Yasminevirus sp. GU-2018 TaxID=2420051 RepID=A0A5K0UB35_9VIRU|nr:hypothetical protein YASMINEVIRUS_1432 [Yasminevirus sp. GU-2018]
MSEQKTEHEQKQEASIPALNLQSPFCRLESVGTSPSKAMKWCVCIDNSGSTGDKLDTKTVLGTEVDFAKKVISSLDPEHKSVSVIRWDDHAEKISYDAIDSLKPDGGTSPANIFRVPECQKAIGHADCLLIMTDGAIGQNEVSMFGHSMMTSGRHFKAVVGVLVGRNHADSTTGSIFNRKPTKQPSDINVSVLVPAMVSNACIMYHDSINTYAMWASGTFRQEWKVVDIEPSTEWENLTKVSLGSDHPSLTDISIPSYDEDQVAKLLTHGYVPLGGGLYFHPDNLLRSTPDFDEIVEYPFSQVCQYFKVNDKYTELVEWFKGRLLDAFTLQEDDKNNFTALIEQMSELPQAVRRDLSNPYMSVYITTRNRHIARRYIASDEDIENQITDPRAVRILQFFRDMIRVMDEDVQMIQDNSNTSYTTSSISTSRYTSSANAYGSGVVQTASRVKQELPTVLTAKFNEPHLWYSQVRRLHPGIDSKIPKHECSVCFENRVPFLLVRAQIDLKELERQNTNELYKHFYPSLMCSRCADFFCQKGVDPVHQPCVAAIPIVSVSLLSSENLDAYINQFSELIIDTSPSTTHTPHSRTSSRGVNLSSRRESMLSSISSAFNAIAHVSSVVSDVFTSSTVSTASGVPVSVNITPKCMISVSEHVKQFMTETEAIVLTFFVNDIKIKFKI